MSLGGDTTDTDLSLGREQSEYIYYIASAVELDSIASYAFIDSNNKIIGFPGGSGTWLMTPKNIQEADGGVLFSTIPKFGSDYVLPAQGRRAQEIASSSSPSIGGLLKTDRLEQELAVPVSTNAPCVLSFCWWPSNLSNVWLTLIYILEIPRNMPVLSIIVG